MVIRTIEELYRWAQEHHVEDFEVFIPDGGWMYEIHSDEIQVDEECQTVVLS